MENAPTDWFSAVAILAGGLILGVLVVFFFNRKKTAKIETDLERKDLEFKRDALIQQLRDLDENASAEERARLEKETAAVLRKLDDRGRQAPPPVAISPAVEPASSSSAMNPAVKGFLWGAGSFALLAGLFYFVMQQSNPRTEGGSVTGGMQQQAQQQQQAAPDPAVLQLEAAVQKDPNNLDLRNNLAQAYLEHDNLMGVFEQTKVVLEQKPEDSRALTFQGLVRMAMGDANTATTMLTKATKSDPKNLDSWVGLAWVYSQTGKMDDAKKAIDAAKKESPSDVPRLDQVWAQMQQHDTTQVASTPVNVESGELPPGHPPIDGSAPASAPVAGAAPASGAAVQVTLDLDPAASIKTGVLYVMARNPMGGPPIAVKRLMPTSFPLTITLSQADSMMGQPLPGSFRLEARLDSDGDAATKPPTDPHAQQDNVAPGATVKLALK